jgi:hypothetical protein
MTEQPSQDVPPLPGSMPETGDPTEGDNQDVPARRIYPTDPTGADPDASGAGASDADPA